MLYLDVSAIADITDDMYLDISAIADDDIRGGHTCLHNHSHLLLKEEEKQI